MRILTIGEILWDVFPDGERLGGAPFNFSAHAARLGHEVQFLSAVGEDERGRKALERAVELGLSTEFIARTAERPTGTVTVELDGAGQPAFTVHRPAAYDCVEFDGAELRRLAAFHPDWIAFGTLHQAEPGPRIATAQAVAACPGAKRFYDVNLRPACYTLDLVEELMALASVVKLNAEEAAALGALAGAAGGPIERFCRAGTERFGWEAVAVTCGAEGCAALVDGTYVEAPGYTVAVADTVGSGDAFAGAFLDGLDRGWPAAQIADFANRLGAVVASRPGAIPAWTAGDLRVLEAPNPSIAAGCRL